MTICPADASFTDWLFAEAARISAPQTTSEPPAAAQAQPAATPVSSSPSITQPKRDSPSDSTRPRAQAIPVFNQALNQALPSGSGQKRTASARSPSPNMNTANKARRMDGPLPTGPRAMHNRDGNAGQGGRSLLDRVGGRARVGHNNRDEIQARIDAVTAQGGSPELLAQMAMNGGLPGGGMGMMPDMNAMNAMAGMNMGGMVNQMALQEMMMNQMALMAQMATTMGILPNPQNQNQGQFPAQANNNVHNRQGNGPQQQGNNAQPRRGGTPTRRGGHGTSNGAQWVAPHITDQQQNAAPSNAPTASTAQSTAGPTTPSVASPTPVPGVAAQPGFTPPSRPQSPTLCKFGLKCTNALCRYAHPSPVATPESGIVLSTDACEAGKNCKDKDCIKSHVSPAAVGVTSVPGQYHNFISCHPCHVLSLDCLAPAHKPAPTHTAPTAPPQIPCRYGANCLKITSGCPFYHPPKAVAAANHFNQQCRFGASCTRAACPFQHPPGRVLPTAFHRGLDPNAPTVNVKTPETGTMGAPSHNKSVVFNKPVPKKPEEDKKEPAKTLEAAA